MQKCSVTATDTQHLSALKFTLGNNLTYEQHEKALKMLSEEEDSFSKGDSDIGCASELQMEI